MSQDIPQNPDPWTHTNSTTPVFVLLHLPPPPRGTSGMAHERAFTRRRRGGEGLLARAHTPPHLARSHTDHRRRRRARERKGGALAHPATGGKRGAPQAWLTSARVARGRCLSAAELRLALATKAPAHLPPSRNRSSRRTNTLISCACA